MLITKQTILDLLEASVMNSFNSNPMSFVLYEGGDARRPRRVARAHRRAHTRQATITNARNYSKQRTQKHGLKICRQLYLFSALIVELMI